MRRLTKSTLGVTLLEVMLVLAIVAIIVVMSVRYYASASAAQQATNTVEQLQAIGAAADTYASSNGSFTGLDGNSGQALWSLLPRNGQRLPWGDDITVTVNSASELGISVPNTPSEACGLVRTNITANRRFTATADCSTDNSPTNLTFTYGRVGT